MNIRCVNNPSPECLSLTSPYDSLSRACMTARCSHYSKQLAERRLLPCDHDNSWSWTICLIASGCTKSKLARKPCCKSSDAGLHSAGSTVAHIVTSIQDAVPRPNHVAVHLMHVISMVHPFSIASMVHIRHQCTTTMPTALCHPVQTPSIEHGSSDQPQQHQRLQVSQHVRSRGYAAALLWLGQWMSALTGR